MVAIAASSIAHTVGDLPAFKEGPLSIASLQDDADGPSDVACVDGRCHFCAVPSFTVSDGSQLQIANAGPIPDGRVLRLSVFRHVATAPPPRALT